MRARAKASHAAAPAVPRTSAARHAKAGVPPAGVPSAGDLPAGVLSAGDLPAVVPPAGDLPAGDLPEEEFDFSQPFEVDLGRAAVIAEGLRESGFPLCTADVVISELARPGDERGVIGRFAADQLERAGWRP